MGAEARAVEDVVPVAAACASLSQILREFRENPASAPVRLGSHRRPEAVLLPYARYRELAAAPRTPSMGELALRRSLIERLARAAGLSEVRVYGSVARGEQRADSDVELLVTPGPEATLFDLAQFEMDMEMLLGVPVSVTSMDALDPERDRQMLAESMSL